MRSIKSIAVVRNTARWVSADANRERLAAGVLSGRVGAVEIMGNVANAGRIELCGDSQWLKKANKG